MNRIKFFRSFVLIIFFMALLIVGSFFINAHTTAFSSNKWALYSDMRYKMIDSLEAKYDLNGKTEQYVLDLLGEPEDVWEYRYDNYYRIFRYYSGPSYAFDPYMYQVVICDGIVTDASLQR